MRLAISLIFCFALSAQTPVLIRAKSGENSRTVKYSGHTRYHTTYLDTTIAGNCAGIFVAFTTATSVTVTDDQSNTYSLAKSVTGSTYKAQVWIAPNVAAGAHFIQLDFGATANFITPISFEVANCATSSPVDATSGQESSGTTITSGSLTPGSSGDMLLNFAVLESSSVPATSSFTPGSQSNITWAGKIAELLDGTLMQYGVYSSTSAINPTMSTGTSQTWISITVALKAASAGGVPTGMYVTGEQHVSMWSTATGGPSYANPSITQFPCKGSAVLIMANGGSPITSVSENAVAMSHPVSYIGTGASESQNIFETTPHTCNNAHTFSIVPDLGYVGPSDDFDYTLVFYDIVSGGAVDQTSTNSGAVSSCSSPCSLTATTLTPTIGGELIFSMMSEFFNGTYAVNTGMSESLYVDDPGTSASYDDSSAVDQQNGWAYYLSPGTSAYTIIWQALNLTRNQGNWAGAAISFEPQAASGIGGSKLGGSSTLGGSVVIH